MFGGVDESAALDALDPPDRNPLSAVQSMPVPQAAPQASLAPRGAKSMPSRQPSTRAASMESQQSMRPSLSSMRPDLSSLTSLPAADAALETNESGSQTMRRSSSFAGQDSIVERAHTIAQEQELEDKQNDEEHAEAAETFAEQVGLTKHKVRADLDDGKYVIVSVVVKALTGDDRVFRYTLMREANKAIDGEPAVPIREAIKENDTSGWDLRIDAVTTKSLFWGRDSEDASPGGGDPVQKDAGGVFLQTVAGSVRPPSGSVSERDIAHQVAFQLIYAPLSDTELPAPYTEWMARAGRGKVAELTGFGEIQATQIDQKEAFWGPGGATELVAKFNTSKSTGMMSAPVLTQYDPCMHTHGLYKVSPGDPDVQKQKGRKGKMTATNTSPAHYRFAVVSASVMTMARFFKPSDEDTAKLIQDSNASGAA